jgi:hypothetical protein
LLRLVDQILWLSLALKGIKYYLIPHVEISNKTVVKAGEKGARAKPISHNTFKALHDAASCTSVHIRVSQIKVGDFFVSFC